MTHSKTQLRVLFRSQRRSRSTQARDDEARGLASSWENACLFFGLHPWAEDEPAALFVPTSHEPPVWDILRRRPHSILPLLIGAEGLLPSPAWGASRHGEDLVLPSPAWPAQPAEALGETALETAKIILVPALAVDEDGARLGQGGGWYDRALVHAQEDAPIIAAVFDDEFVAGGMLPLEPHDHLVNGVITPTRFLPLPVHL